MSAEPDIAVGPAAERPAARVRPFYWSVRRELWEHRSLYIAPLAVAGVIVIGFVLSNFGAAHVSVSGTGADRAVGMVMGTPYSFLAMATLVVGFMASVAYSLAALYGERRDRSVLFWKSLPVSDLTAVLAKAVIPLAVVPVLVAAITIASHLLMLIIGAAFALAGGAGLAGQAGQAPIPGIWATLLWGLTANALWHAPLFAWLLLVSGWAKRAPLLWAIAPPAALGIIEGMAFHTSTIGKLVQDRIVGGPGHAFDPGSGDRLLQIAPVKFLSTPGLWLGLIVAAAFLAAAVWQRRRREPI